MALTMGTIAMDISFTERPVVTRDDIGMAAAYPSTASRPWRPLAEAAVRTIIAYISDNRFNARQRHHGHLRVPDRAESRAGRDVIISRMAKRQACLAPTPPARNAPGLSRGSAPIQNRTLARMQRPVAANHTMTAGRRRSSSDFTGSGPVRA